MSSTQAVIVRQCIENLLGFLEPLLPLANCHMVDYFTKSVYKNNVPESIRQEIDQMGHQKTLDSIFNNDYTNLPHLKTYVDASKTLTAKNNSSVCLMVSDLICKLRTWGCEEADSIKLDVFMTSKKSHEVEIMSAIAATIKDIANTSHIIDIGDGKGYLSSMLALQYHIPVLGIDASEINTNSAVERVRKLSKAWKGLANSPKRSCVAKGDYSKAVSADLYKQVTQFVSEDVNFKELLYQIFLEHTTRIGMVGLHTCGNLASSCLRIFSTDNSMQSICNVGCCYHLLSEKFEDENGNITKPGFPLSDYLSNKKFVLGRRARMIGAQSVDRIFHNKELPNAAIFYRAILQVILEECCEKLPTKHVGKIKKFTDFLDYIRKSMKIVEADISLSDEEINNYYLNYVDRLNELNVFYLVRSMLSPVVESLILLDRLLFLLEEGHERSYLVQLFDPVVSPRCYGLISLKDS